MKWGENYQSSCKLYRYIMYLFQYLNGKKNDCKLMNEFSYWFYAECPIYFFISHNKLCSGVQKSQTWKVCSLDKLFFSVVSMVSREFVAINEAFSDPVSLIYQKLLTPQCFKTFSTCIAIKIQIRLYSLHALSGFGKWKDFKFPWYGIIVHQINF